MKPTNFVAGIVALLSFIFGTSAVFATPNNSQKFTIDVQVLGSAFTYQGILQNLEGAVNAACDFQFSLLDSETGGVQVGTTYTRNAVQVSNGAFAVSLDFGAAAFQGQARWLQIALRCPSATGAFTPISPRQAILATPYAQFARVSAEGVDNFTVHGQLSVEGTGIFGKPGSEGALSLRSPDLFMNADASFGRGDGGRALVHEVGDVLSINHDGDFAGGVKIWSNTIVSGALTVEGNDLFFNGNELEIHGDANRGDGGLALVHIAGDALAINLGGGFSGGVSIDSDARVAKDFTVDGNTLRLLGNDFYIKGDADRGDGGRAIVHVPSDTLHINYEGDFAGGVRITDLRTGAIIEDNLMTTEQQALGSLPEFSMGDVQCWDADLQQLTLCRQEASMLVVSVADRQGRPMIMGAELIKVTGDVEPGDLLVASSQAGYAMVWPSEGNPPTGVVIGKALEASRGTGGLIKAMIMLR